MGTGESTECHLSRGFIQGIVLFGEMPVE